MNSKNILIPTEQDLMNCQVIFFCESSYFLPVFNPLFSKQLTKVCFLKEWLNASGEKVKFTKSICEKEKKKKQGNFSLGKIWNFQLSKCYSLILFISNSVKCRLYILLNFHEIICLFWKLNKDKKSCQHFHGGL